MAATTLATAAGVVVLLCYVWTRRSAQPRKSRRPVAQAPATWFETVMTLSETLRFTYSETLGKWPIADLAFGVNYLIRRQSNEQIASVYAGEDCVQLKGTEIIALLYQYLKLVSLCYFFSKKPFPVFLEAAGYSQEDVLLQKPKAGLLKPAFTILCDRDSKCFLLLVRGTHSMKDTLTAATGAVVPFHHSVIHDGGISNLVLGYAHCGMVAAARWIAKLSIPILLKALDDNPDYEVKIVGHSLGGGTAALLTYILREQNELSAASCVTFAPAACMTWELAESGKHFITTIINGSDLVPTFSAASIDYLRLEVTASSWLNDLRDQVEHNKVLNVIYRSATALGSRLPSVANAKAKVVGAGALLRPVSSSTQGVVKRAQDVARAVVSTSSFSSWTCIGPRRRHILSSPKGDDDLLLAPPLLAERESSIVSSNEPDPNQTNRRSSTGGSGSGHEETDEEDISEGELWYELEKELQRHDNDEEENIEAEEEEAAAKEITEEEKVIAEAVESQTPISSSDFSDSLQFYPPGRIMHMVSVPLPESGGDFSPDCPVVVVEEEHCHVGIYETPRQLYSKIRLSKMMINDHYMPMYKKMMELVITELENMEE